MAKTLYFTRHGETFWNVENKICGATDIALTPKGEEQAAALGYCLAYAGKCLLDGRHTLRQAAEQLEELLERQGLEALCGGRSGMPALARPRRQEILVCLNRYRGLRL